MLPFTAAHEMAHQRGYSREDEANFIAFLVCAESDDSYIRYSGYMNLYEYVISDAYKADKNMYSVILKKMDDRVRGEINSYNEFFDKYRENTVADVSSELNDSYLQSQGQIEGEKSYGMVVRIAVAYYKSVNFKK